MTDFYSNHQMSDFFKFSEPLKGYDVYFNGVKYFKWELFWMSQNKEMRDSISSRRNTNFKYVERQGWQGGQLVGFYEEDSYSAEKFAENKYSNG